MSLEIPEPFTPLQNVRDVQVVEPASTGSIFAETEPMSIGDVSHKTEPVNAGSEVKTDSICIEDVSQEVQESASAESGVNSDPMSSGDEPQKVPREISIRKTGSGNSLLIPIYINGIKIEAVVDHGAEITLISEDLLHRINLSPIEDKDVTLKQAGKESNMPAMKACDVALQLGDQEYKWDMYVAPIHDMCLLGYDFMLEHDLIALPKKAGVLLNDQYIQGRNRDGSDTAKIRRVTIKKKLVVPPNTTVHAKVQVHAEPSTTFLIDATQHHHKGLLIPRLLVRTPDDDDDRTARLRDVIITVMNDCDSFRHLKRGHLIGEADLLQEYEIIQDTSDFDRSLSSKEMSVNRLVSDNKDIPLTPSDSAQPESDVNLDRSLSDKGKLNRSKTDESTTSVSDVNLDRLLSDKEKLNRSETDEFNDAKTTSTQDKLQNATTVEEVEAQVPEHLQDLWRRSIDHLNFEETKKLASTLTNYADIFSVNELDLGCFSGVTHHIDTGTTKPIRQGMRRAPMAFQDEEKKHLESLLKINVIQPSSSDWASPPVLVRKKNGKLRYCLDYRKLNQVTVKDAYPLLNISECLDSLGNAQFFSALDMSSGYYQIMIAEEDRPKTAFITKYGLFEHIRMPFGLCNAPATFQRAISLVLRGLTWKEVLAYLDDIIIIGTGFNDHMYNLVKVFDRLRLHHLKLNAKKCDLFRREVIYLGKLVSNKGVSANPENVSSVLNWPKPKDVKEIQQFLGMVNYHRAHIKNFSHISRPLCILLKKSVKFDWGKEQQEAFDSLKKALVSAPCLSFPRNNDEPFILDTDASGVAIGAELIQVQDGEERVIAYGSYSLTPSQRNYCTTRKELLAIVRFTRQFRHYLLGRKFYVRTDHCSLTWLLSFKNPGGTLARWLEELSQYDMVIIYRKGATHTNADGHSRIPDDVPFCDYYTAHCTPKDLPCYDPHNECRFCVRAHKQWSKFEEDVDDVVPLTVRRIQATEAKQSFNVQDSSGSILQVVLPGKEQEDDGVTLNTSYTPQNMRAMQLNDSDIKSLIVWIEEGVDPSQRVLHLSSPAVRNFWVNRTLLEMKDGVLYYHWCGSQEEDDRILLVVPHPLKQKVLHHCHDAVTAGHPGMMRTLARLRRRYYWYQMRKDCDIHVKSCKQCSRQKKANVNPRGGLGMFHAGYPVERLHLDILGPFPESSSGNKYILMLICQFTKWLEAYALADQTAEEITKAVVYNFISRFGIPEHLHTDQGRNFTGKLFEGICKLLDITKTRTTPYRPCSNGQVERYNRTLLQLIRCHLKQNSSWDEDLPILTSAIRSVPNRTTGFTPNLLMLGREVRLPEDLFCPYDERRQEAPCKFVQELQERLRSIHAVVRENLKGTQMQQKEMYDKKMKQVSYQVGDIVLRRKMTPPRKVKVEN